MSLVRVGKVIELFYSTSDSRVNTTTLLLDTKGVVEDKYYDKDVDRSILLSSLWSYTLASEENINVPLGALGENLLIDYNPYHLIPGTKLVISDVTLEISQNCTLCKSFAKINERLPEILKDDRGIFAKVISSGTISIDDNIYLLDI